MSGRRRSCLRRRGVLLTLTDGRYAEFEKGKGRSMKAERFAFVVATCLLLASTAVQASVITFETSVEYSGATAPSGPAPWMTATFDDGGSAGSVTLTLSETNLTGSESVMVWMFNVDPNVDPDDANQISFSAPTPLSGVFTAPIVSLGTDAFRADGDGYFDIKIEFDGSDGANQRFGVGDSVQFTITGPGLLAGSFNYISAEDGGAGEWPTAAHVLGTGAGEESGWVTVPGPATLFVMAAAGLPVLLRRWPRPSRNPELASGLVLGGLALIRRRTK